MPSLLKYQQMPGVNGLPGPPSWSGFSGLLCLGDSCYSPHRLSLLGDLVSPTRVCSLNRPRYQMHMSLFVKEMLVGMGWVEGGHLTRSAGEGTGGRDGSWDHN